MHTRPHLYALIAIALWASFALLAVQLAKVPPFMLLGLSLTIGSLVGVRKWRCWRVPAFTFAVGCGGLFGYHFCMFIAFRFAPPIEVNLLNYLWPLLIVLLSPIFVDGAKLLLRHVAGGFLGLAGCCVLLLGRATLNMDMHHLAGYALAIFSAFIWSTYSLMTRRLPLFPTAAVGGFCLASGLMALIVHGLIEPSYYPDRHELIFIALLGLGPMGCAFYLWDAALKQGNTQTIGILAYLTPIFSTSLLALSGNGRFSWAIGLSLTLILSGAWLGSRVTQTLKQPSLANIGG